MKLSVEPQPDQQPARWNDHVAVYEAVFEPLTNAFGRRAFERLGLKAGARLIDIGAGSGGIALMAARNGADVLAIDASQEMITRIRQRASSMQSANRIRAEVMDGMALTLPDASFDAAISVFGVILFPDAGLGMRELARVLKPGGRTAVVTWTQSDRYELRARLLGAIAAVRGPQPPPVSLPAQLRFRDEPAFRNLFEQAELMIDDIVILQEKWRLPSAQWIADRIAFAPGMTAMVGALGADRAAILDAFVTAIERDHGRGEIALTAVAHAAIAQKPS
jgi:SAM-dependent methyltransferase